MGGQSSDVEQIPTTATTATTLSKAKIPENVWQIHGKQYDFSSFVKRHPGGEEMILIGKGRDCTELFESVHSLASNAPWSLLKKYETSSSVDGAPAAAAQGQVKGEGLCSIEGADDMFQWKKEGFYATCTARVKEYLKKEGLDYKAPWYYFVKCAALLMLSVYCLYKALTGSNLIFAALAGLFEEQLHFCTMHDGSHFGVSHNPLVNKVFVSITYWFFWDPWLWLRHHVYGHHCFTGIYRKDPDVTNSNLFMRKHPDAKWKPKYTAQQYHGWFWMSIFPNQHWGQTLVYAFAHKARKLFGMPLEKRPKDYIKPIVWPTSFFVHFILPLFFMTFSRMLLVNFIIWTVIGTSYFFVIIPNHDNDLVMKSSSNKKIDWGELQVRNSSNHSINYEGNFVHKVVTHLYGGMNFQIEHHLFPSMSHEHYARIAPIVQQTCKEFNIPYNANESWMGAMHGFYKVLKQLATK